jgi:hypothetical protein
MVVVRWNSEYNGIHSRGAPNGHQPWACGMGRSDLKHGLFRLPPLWALGEGEETPRIALYLSYVRWQSKQFCTQRKDGFQFFARGWRFGIIHRLMEGSACGLEAKWALAGSSLTLLGHSCERMNLHELQ